MAFKKTSTKENKLNYEVVEKCGVIATDGDWELELRLIKWNGRSEKYDLRYWGTDDDGNEICKKGITLTSDEIEGLQKLLNEMN